MHPWPLTMPLRRLKTPRSTPSLSLDANDTDLDGDALTVVAGTFATAQGGSITIAADGSYTYTPAPNFNGSDSVDYTVTDGSLTDVGTLNITVTAVNDAPIAVDDAITATEDTPSTRSSSSMPTIRTWMVMRSPSSPVPSRPHRVAVSRSRPMAVTPIPLR